MQDSRKCGRDVTKTQRRTALTLGIAIATLFVVATNAQAQQSYCSQTADALFVACKAGVTDDSLVKKAICINVSDGRDRRECLDELAADRGDSLQLCRDQHDWRL